jgi:hypothetical protein
VRLRFQGGTETCRSRTNRCLLRPRCSLLREPLINGSDTDFSEPYSLTYPGSGYPIDEPRPELYTSYLTGFSDGAIDSNQLWSADEGILGG